MYTGKMQLNDRVDNYIPIQDQARRNPDAYGIEVELEGKNFLDPTNAIMQYWTTHKDGSLRIKNPGDCAVEYVTRQPFDMQNTRKAITLLFDYLNSPGVEVYESYRTSIHVHVNFATDSFLTIYNFMTLALILDELLVSQNGEHRVGNIFCLRARDALGQVQSLIHSINQGNNFFGVASNERYSSINFVSLLKFGTIEFRSLECTTHEGRLLHWIGTLTEMKKSAKKYKNPVEIIEQFSVLGPKQFIRSVLGPFADKYLFVDNMDQMLFNGMRIAQDLAYCSAWNDLSLEDIEKAKAKKQKEDDAVMAMIKKKTAMKAAQW